MNRRKFLFYVSPAVLTLAVRPAFARSAYLTATAPLGRDAAAPPPKAKHSTTGGDPLLQRVLKACGVGR